MVSDQELAEALESLLRQANPNTSFTSLHDVVQQLESKLGLDLSHKVEFIRNQIHVLFRPQQPQQQQQQQIVHHRVPPPQKDHFAPQQSHVFHPTPAQNFALHRTEEFAFRPQQSPAPPVDKIEAYGSTASAAKTADIVASAVEQPAETSKERSVLFCFCFCFVFLNNMLSW